MAPLAANAGSSTASARNSPAVGATTASGKARVPNGVNGHPAGSHPPLSAMRSPPLDMWSVERKGQPTSMREPVQKKSRPLGLEDAPTYCPTEEEWRDPFEYIKKISPEAQQYGICKIVPPESWNPGFAINTERFHFRTRKQQLNSVEGTNRANINYVDGLAKFHRQQGNNLHRMPYVDKKPLDLYRLKKAVECRGGFDKVCKLKKWAEIGRDLGYSGKIMSSLSTSLKNSYSRWLCPYEEYLKLAKPGVHQQLEYENGGPFTPSPAVTPMKRSNVNTPSSVVADSPARNATDALQASINGRRDLDPDTSMGDAPTSTPPTAGFTAINSGGFTAVNAGFTSVNRPAAASESKGFNPDKHLGNGSSASAARDAPEYKPSSLGLATNLKRRQSCDSVDSGKKDSGAEKDDGDVSGRRSKRLKKETIPTVAGSHMTLLKIGPRFPKEEAVAAGGERCEQCGKADDVDFLLVCESCDHSYHGSCLDPPLRAKPEGDWNCPRCLVGDGQFGFEEGGLYSLKQFQEKALQFKQNHFSHRMPYDPVLKCHRPVTEEDVELEFWRLVTDLEEMEVEYGADIHCTTHGSGFPTPEKNPLDPYSFDPWNLNILPLHSDSLFKHIKSDIPGMTVPWVYVGMTFSTFCWHNEDHWSYSANYQHFGDTKTWYGIPGEDADKFENAMREAIPELFETQPDLLFQLVTLMTPEQLKKAGVRVYAVDQRAGQFVITFPQAYHAGFNHGFNFNEAVNFAPPDWEPFGLHGVEKLQQFRRHPCFSHDELLWTAAEGRSSELTIQTAKWLAPALERIQERELAHREAFLARHHESAPHNCDLSKTGPECQMLKFAVEDVDVPEEEYQCAYCKAFTYLSRFKCSASGKVFCLRDAGTQPCCDVDEDRRLVGPNHSLIYRKTKEQMEAMYQKVCTKARVPEEWEERYDVLLEEEDPPTLRSLRNMLHEAEKIPHHLPSMPSLRHFVGLCTDWVEEATSYTVRKQQNRRKNEKALVSRKSTTNGLEKKERDVSNMDRLLRRAERLRFDCPEIGQLRERVEVVKAFQDTAAATLKRFDSDRLHLAPHWVPEMEELLEEGRSFNVDLPEVDGLAHALEQLQWGIRASELRTKFITMKDAMELLKDGKRFDVSPYNEHFAHFTNQVQAGLQWEEKARELTSTPEVNFSQLEALHNQVNASVLPVSDDLYHKVDNVLHNHRDAARQVLALTERSHNEDYRKRPKYSEVGAVMTKIMNLSGRPVGVSDLEKEQKRVEDWMREGKRLFGKTNAPLHILKSHMEYVLERNRDCFDIENDKPRTPAEPASRDVTPDAKVSNRWEDPKFREVFCICRKTEAGLMIECEYCREWYHSKCLKIARGKIKEDDKYTCPICDWRVTLPRDAARPKLEDLIEWYERVPGLPFQPDEEEILHDIIDNAQKFRTHLAQYCSPLVATSSEVETVRFYLRKIEGAEILLAKETNYFRQQLHYWTPVAPEAPPTIGESKSTRKPRPTKLQKMLAEHGVSDPDDLPDHLRAKANSLLRKQLNNEAAAVANSTTRRPHGPGAPGSSRDAAGMSHMQPYYHPRGADSPHSTSPSAGDGQDSFMDIDGTMAINPALAAGGPSGSAQGSWEDSTSLMDKLLGFTDETLLKSVTGAPELARIKAMEMLSRTEEGRQKGVRVFGADAFLNFMKEGDLMDRLSGTELAAVDMGVGAGAMAVPSSAGAGAMVSGLGGVDPADESVVDQMFTDLTNQDDDGDKSAGHPNGKVKDEGGGADWVSDPGEKGKGKVAGRGGDGEDEVMRETSSEKDT